MEEYCGNIRGMNPFDGDIDPDFEREYCEWLEFVCDQTDDTEENPDACDCPIHGYYPETNVCPEC